MLCVYGAVCDTALSRRELTDFPLVDEKPVFALLTTGRTVTVNTYH